VRILLDTNALLWAASGRIDSVSAESIDNANNEVFYSTASIWEIVIKRGLGRKDFVVDPYRLIDELGELGYKRLDIKEDHILAVGTLPETHSDPFDRILIAQASYERMALMTADEKIFKYNISTIKAKKTR
jgi:PIN domain nuclease of toxin-antitoxin system